MDETLQCEDLRKNMNCENAPRCLKKDTSYLLIHTCTPICTRTLVKGGGLWNQGTYNALGTSQQKTTYIHAKCLWTFKFETLPPPKNCWTNTSLPPLILGTDSQLNITHTSKPLHPKVLWSSFEHLSSWNLSSHQTQPIFVQGSF